MNIGMSTFRFLVRFFAELDIIDIRRRASHRISRSSAARLPSSLPSGYCRVTNIQQGKEIEKRLYSLLPEKLNTEVVKTNDSLALLIYSSEAENIFQQSNLFLFIRTCFSSKIFFFV
jgi:hypothetical protein